MASSKSFFFFILWSLTFLFVSFPAISTDSLDEIYGGLKSPLMIKPWEIDSQTNQVYLHPKTFGILNFDDPKTWSNVPKPPAPGKKIYGLWLLGPNGNAIFAENIWKFKTTDGKVVSVSDSEVIQKDSKLIGAYTRPDGSVETLTDLLGDTGHPTLAAHFPNNPKLQGRLAGDYQIEKTTRGKLFVRLNNVSGRYMAYTTGGLMGHQKELKTMGNKIAMVYGIDSSQVETIGFEGNPPLTKSERFTPQKLDPVAKPELGNPCIHKALDNLIENKIAN